MSVRIKLPAAKVVDAEANQEPTTSEPIARRRKAAKRRIAVVSDEEDDDGKHPNTIPSSPHGTNSPRDRSHTLEVESELDAGHIAASVETRSSHPPEPSTSHPRKQKLNTPGSGPPPNKKKRFNKGTDLDNGDYSHFIESIDDDQEVIMENKSRLKPTKKAKPRGEKAKSLVNAENPIKDQAHAQHGQPQTKRARISLKAEDAIVDIDGELGTKLDTQSPLHFNEPSPLPKKRKLPTIKKNKGAVPISASSMPTKAQSTAALAKNLPTKPTEASNPPPVGVRKTPASLGNADFDLRNPSVYTELFKSAGGNTPRSGLSRREKDDERRKELHKMRDDARAKRLTDMAPSFDLQAQTDKILRFEERLRSDHSTALYPNFLGAKWRELWEKEKRRAKERASGETGEREEGEMNESTK